MQTITITETEAGQRLDKFLARYFRGAGKGFLYKMLRKKNIERNGKKSEPGAILCAGDRITLWLSDETIAHFRGTPEEKQPQEGSAADFAYTVIYEDEALILANKPAGVLSQKASALEDSLNEALLSRVRRSQKSETSEDLGFRPSVVNRLDRNTSGIIVFAKTYQSARMLSELFAERSLEKYYYALVSGTGLRPGRYTAYLKKDPAANRSQISGTAFPGSVRIEASYETLYSAAGRSLLRIRLLTGKSHQLRAHLSFLGYPILGDPKYGDPLENRRLRASDHLSRQLLHAGELRFPNALSGPLTSVSGRRFTAPPPDDFLSVLSRMGGTIIL